MPHQMSHFIDIKTILLYICCKVELSFLREAIFKTPL